jgi:hypothetical protein
MPAITAPSLYVYLPSFPMPISVNALYRPGRGRAVKKSEAYENYTEEVRAWNLRNLKVTMQARDAMREALAANPNLRLRVDAVFYFQPKKILCKNGSVKTNDTSNRLKALHDAIAYVLVINDKLFWSGSFDKECAPPHSPEWVNITITARTESECLACTRGEYPHENCIMR